MHYQWINHMAYKAYSIKAIQKDIKGVLQTKVKIYRIAIWTLVKMYREEWKFNHQYFLRTIRLSVHILGGCHADELSKLCLFGDPCDREDDTECILSPVMSAEGRSGTEKCTLLAQDRACPLSGRESLTLLWVWACWILWKFTFSIHKISSRDFLLALIQQGKKLYF